MKNKEQQTFPFIERLLDGAEVEWKKLGEVCDFKRGKSLQKSDIGLGDIPIILYGELYTIYGNYITEIASYTSLEKAEKATLANINDLLLPLSSTTKEAKIGKVSTLCLEKTIYIGGDTLILSHLQNAGYLVYLLNSEWFEKRKMKCVKGTTIMHLSPKELANILIPIPPLSVQERIVEILDKFTTLEAELDCRKRQYEFYRNQLLTFDILNKECVKVGKRKVMPLGEIVTIKNGKSYKHLSMGNIPVYGSGGIMCFVDEYVYNKPSVLIPRKGSLENIFYIEEPFWNVDTIFYTEINDKIIMPKFLYYYLLNQHLEKLNLAGGVPSLTQKVLNKILIPIPPLAEQERIVSILDKFDTLTTSISEGLPKEIELRRKQYEYYRERLLSFRH